ncbi:putative membrane protein YdfJ with MMPL/SSD domain [Streptomyces canus]|nr:putative membrane protein YdfJ with MMPL/SSD domain [Streptomyces canus]
MFGVEQTGPIMSLMPIFLVGIVFGLAMDYEVFLVSRMREAYIHGEPAVVFAGFIGESDSMIKMIGFGLATEAGCPRSRATRGDRVPAGLVRPASPSGPGRQVTDQGPAA